MEELDLIERHLKSLGKRDPKEIYFPIIQMKCKKQNVWELLKKAEIKMNASPSHSISAKDTTALPTDSRVQIAVGDGSTSEIPQKHSRRKV